MVKCKILWVNKKPQEVEDVVNEWLAQHPKIEIKSVAIQPNWAFAIFYEEK